MVYTEDFNSNEVAYLNEVFASYCKYFGIENQVNAEFVCVSEDEIRQLNADNRGVDDVTDVLSFPNNDKISFPLKLQDYPFDINPENGMLDLGSVALCREVLVSHAEEYGNTYEREFKYICVHALLHLIGYDHILEADKAVMREKEEAILAQ